MAEINQCLLVPLAVVVIGGGTVSLILLFRVLQASLARFRGTPLLSYVSPAVPWVTIAGTSFFAVYMAVTHITITPCGPPRTAGLTDSNAPAITVASAVTPCNCH